MYDEELKELISKYEEEIKEANDSLESMHYLIYHNFKIFCDHYENKTSAVNKLYNLKMKMQNEDE